MNRDQNFDEGIHAPGGGVPNEMGVDPRMLRRNINGNANEAEGRQAPPPQGGIVHPHRGVLRDIQRPIIGISPSCIVLSA
uniref:hypothetical protein n=1 Tax=Vibrio vulnificus TaxID=672 RepID=UPI0019D4D262